MNKRTLLAMTCVLCCACPGQGTKRDGNLPVFEVASVKADRSETAPMKLAFSSDGLTIENAPLLSIIRAAYGMFNSSDDNFSGVPDWARIERFDITARVDGDEAAEFQKLNFDQRQLMVQALLADRFKLETHLETREQPIYMLVIAKGGSKLQMSRPAEDADPGGTMKVEHGRIAAQNVVLSQFVTALTRTLGRTVVDKTEGLRGKYDFALSWTPDDSVDAPPQGLGGSPSAADVAGPSIFTAIQEQLGLKLESGKGPVECLVIDHLERPSAN